MSGQSRKHSALEAFANIAIGYGVAVIAQALIFPLFGIYIRIGDNLAIGACFTVVSLVRSFVLRRAFEAWRLRHEG